MSAASRKPAAALSARNADPHALYEQSVQRPDVMIGFIEELFDHARDRAPRTVREDFCGTAHLAALWTCSGDHRRAIGVDHDAGVLGWARRHNVQPLGEARRRIDLIHGDVLDVRRQADAVVSLNFSHFTYHTRENLRRYFRHARRCVKPGGLFICDAFGGPESIRPCLDKRRFSRFEYHWEQRAFDPLTNRIDCRIHFRFPNGTALRDAFAYDWRMWSLPELRELLAEAGFDDLGIYFESEEGFIADFDAVDFEAWVAYVVALRN
jgi:SAM-dependent methyltransferase